MTGENIRFLHESTREILYVHEDVNGHDEVLSLDFWEKSGGNQSNDINDDSNPDNNLNVNEKDSTKTINEYESLRSTRPSQETHVEDELT